MGVITEILLLRLLSVSGPVNATSLHQSYVSLVVCSGQSTTSLNGSNLIPRAMQIFVRQQEQSDRLRVVIPKSSSHTTTPSITTHRSTDSCWLSHSSSSRDIQLYHWQLCKVLLPEGMSVVIDLQANLITCNFPSFCQMLLLWGSTGTVQGNYITKSMDMVVVVSREDHFDRAHSNLHFTPSES